MRTLTETTITSIDRISAYDTMSRKAMLEGLDGVVGGRAVLPFERLFFSSPSAYLWEDDDGEVHTIHQGEGGEQGDALMPFLFCVAQHAALETIQRGMNPDEKLLAFLNDLYIVSKPQRVRTLHSVAQLELWAHCRIRVHGARMEPSWTRTRGVQHVAESGRSS